MRKESSMAMSRVLVAGAWSSLCVVRHERQNEAVPVEQSISSVASS